MLAINLLEESESFNLSKLKFHIVDHIPEDPSWFGAINVLDTSPFEHSNYFIKKIINETSMRHSSTLEVAAKAMNPSVALEERRNYTGGGIWNAKLFRNRTIINLVGIAISTLVSLAHIDHDGRLMLPSQCSQFVSNAIWIEEHQFLPCGMNMNNFMSGYTHGGILITFDVYDEQSSVIKMNSATSEILQRVYADKCFGASKAKRFSVTSMEGEEKAFWFSRVLATIISSQRLNMSGEILFVRDFEITPPIDNVDRVLSCLY